MAERSIDALPVALIREQLELEGECERINDLPADDPAVLRYQHRAAEHTKRVQRFIDMLQHWIASLSPDRHVRP